VTVRVLTVPSAATVVTVKLPPVSAARNCSGVGSLMPYWASGALARLRLMYRCCRSPWAGWAG
jgi:hypothetical protein